MTSSTLHSRAREEMPGSPASWLDDHGDILFRYARQRVGEDTLAEDLVQETLLAALKSHDDFQSRSTVRTWLIGILRHKILDHYRRQRRGRASESDQTLPPELVEQQYNRRGIWKEAVSTWNIDPADLSQQEELRASLAGCLEKLPPQAADVFIMRERQELTAEELGTILGLSGNHIGVLLFRARSLLRKCLENTWGR